MDDLKTRVCAAIDARGEALFAFADAVAARPELGFHEVETAQRFSAALADLGIRHETGLALTGVRAVLEGGAPGPTVAVLGELDALPVPGHPRADPATGVAHACGHNAQLAMVLGVAHGLIEGDALPHLAGRVVLMAVPAEEYVELERRLELRRQGRLEFLSGKAELFRLGAFDDVDMAMMVHTISGAQYRAFAFGSSNNGVAAKLVRFVGRASHAGSSPEQGINALNAAHVALAAMHAQRETYRDADHVRVHPIITRGGDVVNAVPADVRMEMFVRGASLAAIADASAKVDRALRAGALAIGARVEVTTLPGYLPMQHDPTLVELFKANAARLVGSDQITDAGHRGGSTDMGDLSQVMPTVHPYAGGVVGQGHGADYEIVDPERAIANPARALAMTVVDLLADDAAQARRVLATARPPLTRDGYLAFIRDLQRTWEYAEEPAP
ncbi:MAG TPA: amidohydrolase [Chloroflexota bacterium]|nr:amidohydrolase [Chloroflexota bacterium]